jgi:hypothetical protein
MPPCPRATGQALPLVGSQALAAHHAHTACMPVRGVWCCAFPTRCMPPTRLTARPTAAGSTGQHLASQAGPGDHPAPAAARPHAVTHAAPPNALSMRACAHVCRWDGRWRASAAARPGAGGQRQRQRRRHRHHLHYPAGAPAGECPPVGRAGREARVQGGLTARRGWSRHARGRAVAGGRGGWRVLAAAASTSSGSGRIRAGGFLPPPLPAPAPGQHRVHVAGWGQRPFLAAVGMPLPRALPDAPPAACPPPAHAARPKPRAPPRAPSGRPPPTATEASGCWRASPGRSCWRLRRRCTTRGQSRWTSSHTTTSACVCVGRGGRTAGRGGGPGGPMRTLCGSPAVGWPGRASTWLLVAG